MLGCCLVASDPPPPCLQALAARCLVARGDCQATLAFGNSAPTGVLRDASRTTALTRTEVPEVEASWPLSIIKVISGPPD